jgi:hypothetical protein
MYIYILNLRRLLRSIRQDTKYLEGCMYIMQYDTDLAGFSQPVNLQYDIVFVH